jgi:BASS family bile acid:Na+ symporter
MPDHRTEHDLFAPVAQIGAWMHRRFLPLLTGVYLLSGFAPGPGIALRQWKVDVPGLGSARVSMWLLAVLLFCAAAVIRWSEVRDLVARPAVLVAGLLCTWFGPAALVAITGQILPLVAADQSIAGLMIGMAMVAAMPVANSSAGWTQNSGGNVALSLGLIVASILLSPLMTPSLLKLMGLALSPEDTVHIQQVVKEFSGREFILWVILPSALGGACAWICGAQRIARAKPWFRLATLSVILALNYANASLAVDKIWKTEQLRVVLLAALLATLISLVGVTLAIAESRVLKVSRASSAALLYGLSMNHTGLSLVLAGEFLSDQPRAILVILLTTLAQHLVAAIVDRVLAHEPAPAHAK